MILHRHQYSKLFSRFSCVPIHFQCLKKEERSLKQFPLQTSFFLPQTSAGIPKIDLVENVLKTGFNDRCSVCVINLQKVNTVTNSSYQSKTYDTHTHVYAGCVLYCDGFFSTNTKHFTSTACVSGVHILKNDNAQHLPHKITKLNIWRFLSDFSLSVFD